MTLQFGKQRLLAIACSKHEAAKPSKTNLTPDWSIRDRECLSGARDQLYITFALLHARLLAWPTTARTPTGRTTGVLHEISLELLMCRSQFFVSLKSCEHLNNKHSVLESQLVRQLFGKRVRDFG